MERLCASRIPPETPTERFARSEAMSGRLGTMTILPDTVLAVFLCSMFPWCSCKRIERRKTCFRYPPGIYLL